MSKNKLRLAFTLAAVMLITSCSDDENNAIAPKFLGMTEQEQVDEFMAAEVKSGIFERMDGDSLNPDSQQILVASTDSAALTQAIKTQASNENEGSFDEMESVATDSSEPEQPIRMASSEHAGKPAESSESQKPVKTPVSPHTMMPPAAGMSPHTMMPPAAMGNPHAMMNPMMGGMNYQNMMMPMFNPMAMMGPMMNPQMHGYWMNMMAQMMMNPTVDGMTSAQTLDSMMRMMDPKLALAMMGGTYEQREDDDVPDMLPIGRIPGFPTQTYKNMPKNTVSPGVSDEAKKNAFQTMMMISPLSMRDMLSIMAYKLPLEEGVTWEDAVDSMMIRANEVNFKFVGSAPMYKEIEALTGEPTPKLEIFRFCDALVARKILDYMPEFVIFLPCQIALVEDADGQLWVMTMDWDVSWLDFAQNPNSHLSKELRADATRIREHIRYIMEGAATGDF